MDAFKRFCEKYRKDPETGKANYCIIQAEDELGAIGMVLGAGIVIAVGISLVMVIWYCMPGTAGDNRYGPDPLAEAANPTVYY